MAKDMMKKIGQRAVYILLFFLIILPGCRGTMRYINPEANFSYIKTVAVLPFNNMSGDQFAGEKVRGIVIIDLMSRKVFDVVEQGEVAKNLGTILRSIGADAGNVVSLDKETLKMVGEKLGIQAVIMGSVDEYPNQESGTVSISMRMLDTSSGTVLWQSSATVHGKTLWRDFLGIEGLHKINASRKAVRRALNTLL